MFFGVLPIMTCATAINDFLGVLCVTIGGCSLVSPVSLSLLATVTVTLTDNHTQCMVVDVRPPGHEIVSYPYFLVLIFTIWCPTLRTLSCLTMFCDHNL